MLKFYDQSSKHIMQCNTMIIERRTKKHSSKAWWILFHTQLSFFFFFLKKMMDNQVNLSCFSPVRCINLKINITNTWHIQIIMTDRMIQTETVIMSKSVNMNVSYLTLHCLILPQPPGRNHWAHFFFFHDFFFFMIKKLEHATNI